MVKAVQLLVEQGLIASVRGRHGGLRLARAPEKINIGALIRLTEREWDLVECFNLGTNTCPIEPVCGLKQTLEQAQRAFLDVLDERTLADFLPQSPSLIRLLKRRE
jgi:Rrf2 family nitric oxide-sensitive transcriptional repressor